MYSDSDYASDKINNKSIYDNVLLLGEGSIFWINKKQKSVFMFIMKAEYVKLFKASNHTK